MGLGHGESHGKEHEQCNGVTGYVGVIRVSELELSCQSRISAKVYLRRLRFNGILI